MNKRIGIHVRIDDSIMEMVKKARRLDLPLFQCLLVNQTTRRLIEPTPTQARAFKAACKRYRIEIFQHASYYFNLCSPATHPIPPILIHELHMGQHLGIEHMVLHPGTMVESVTRQSTIALLARTMDALIDQFPTTKFYLENTASNGESAIGSDLQDFAKLLSHMKHAKKLFFCIDTSHAYGYGYDIGTIQGQDAFIALIEDTIGRKRVGLIHLNNTDKTCGSGLDRHIAWRNGVIPPEFLIRFMNYRSFKKVPIILELPVRMTEQHEKQMVDEIVIYEKGEKR